MEYGSNHQTQGEQTNNSALLGWLKDHLEVSASYEFSVGWQLGGGLKKDLFVSVDLGSSVHSDAEWSYKKGISGGKYRPHEKENWGFGAAYYAGFDFQQQTYKGQKINNLSGGAFGFIGGDISWNDDGVKDWFFGIDISAKIAVIFGVNGEFKLGFSK